jgi:2-polyprenyl-6-methoxyphenol hydroxylase-like FAD-dependent oxidoreductase
MSQDQSAAQVEGVIVGSGPAGAAAAIEFRVRRMDVLLHQANRGEPLEKCSIWNQSQFSRLDVWDGVGAAVAIRREGIAWVGARPGTSEQNDAASSTLTRGKSPVSAGGSHLPPCRRQSLC